MFYLAKGLALSPLEVIQMEFVEFMVWVDLLIEHNLAVQREHDRAMAEARQHGR